MHWINEAQHSGSVAILSDQKQWRLEAPAKWACQVVPATPGLLHSPSSFVRRPQLRAG
jgi:hypothetical protein